VNGRTSSELGSRLDVWVVYQNPSDYPGKFVVRPFYVNDTGIRASTDCTVHDDLESARRTIPAGRVRLRRHNADDSVIVETWV